MDSQRAHEFGVEHGIGELTHDFVQDDDINHLGWELTNYGITVTELR